MKRVLAYVLIVTLGVFTLSSCQFQNTGVKTTEKVDKRTQLEKFCTGFMSRHPGGLNNDVTKEKMNEEFKKEIADSLKLVPSMISDFPLSLRGVKSIPGNSNQCYVHFQSWIKPDGFEFEERNLHEICFDIVGKAPASFAEILVEDKYYTIKGEFKGFLTHSQFKKYTNKMAYTPKIGIEKEGIPSGWYNVALGEMLFDIAEITPYKK